MDSPVVFLGLDLAWSERNPSGVVRLEVQGDGSFAVAEHRSLSSDLILEWIEQTAPRGPAVLAVDAPIIAPNEKGTGRPVDREVSRLFGRYHAGVYPGNRERCAYPIRLAEALVKCGWSLDPDDAPAGSGRYAVEVYPHAASIGLLRIDRIIKYKKGRVDARRQGLCEFQRLIHERLPALDPPIVPFPFEDTLPLKGRQMKSLEDRLDALVCAAMGVRWRYRSTLCDRIGDVQEGYILAPRIS